MTEPSQQYQDRRRVLRHPLSWLLIGALTLFAVFWEKSPRDLLAPDREAEIRFPNAYMLDVETREYSPNGSLEHHLRARRVEHHQQNPRRAGAQDYTLIEQPLMTFYSEAPDQQPWQLTALQGRSEQEGALITLDRAVRAWKETDDQVLELITEQLIVKPAEQYAETDKAVKMRSPQGFTDAVGMRALMAEDRIELLSEVKGRYEP